MYSPSSQNVELNERLPASVYMERCLHLASLGKGNTAPNPMVGAILVYEGRIIGEGYHEKFGEAHAEVNCIHSVKPVDRPLIPLATLYCSLEPCSHHGKTPPCADLIIREKIPIVVIGCRDPFPAVNGKGIEKLRANGVTVDFPVLEEPAKEMNRRFFTFHHEKRPYIILKWAQSSNMKIAADPDKRILISNKYSNRLVHKWRSEEAGILVGTTTALLDNPALTTRLWTGKNPVRIVLDQNGRLPDSLKIMDGTVPTIVLNGKTEKHSGGITYKKLNEDIPMIPSILSALHASHILSVLVEGGKKLLQSFIDAGSWDEMRVITNNELNIREGISAPEIRNAILVNSETFGTDTVSYYHNNAPMPR